MFDQLRFDYLSCAGHPHLETPNIDRLASMGVRFSHTYVQSPVCGASRMCFYTGRYVSSHGAAWNNYPLKVGELTIGDHLRKLGVDSWLIGKTHMKVDADGMDRLGLSTDSIIGARLSECGFDVHTRDDGLWGQGPDGFYDERRSPFNEYLKEKGYVGENPWANNANAGVLDDGTIASGWLTANAVRPANIAESDSETPWLTSQMIDFLESDAAQKPWLCHLSFIKPHWPYIVPAPYHNMYDQKHIQPVVRAPSELNNPHPVYQAFTQNMVGKSFQRDEVRESVIPAYMGLIKQCDDQMGRLFEYLENSGRMEDTMIVLSSDHGDYLGDHWLGEKELFHDPSVRVPLIVYDPRKQADTTRGTVCDKLIETIDLAATFIDATGGEIPDHIVEGRSLVPLLHGEAPDNWRDFAISEYDYSAYPLADKLNIAPKDARLFMVVTKRWKLMHAEGGFRPMLFDLKHDPQELTDLGDSDTHAEVITQLYEMLFKWARRNSQRTTVSEAEIRAKRTSGSTRKGILFGYHNEAEADPELFVKYQGKAPPIPDK